MGMCISALASVDYLAKYGFEFYPFGFVNIAVYAAILVYAIVRHHLLDVNIIIKRTVVFSILLLIVFAFVDTLSFLVPNQLLRVFKIQINPVWLNLISIMFVVVFFNPLQKWLSKLTERFLFQVKSDHRMLLQRFTQKVLKITNMKQLAFMTVNTLTKSIKIENCGLWLYSENEGRLDLTAQRNFSDQKHFIPCNRSMVVQLIEKSGPLSVENASAGKSLPDFIKKTIEAMDARLILPLVLQDQMIGLLSLGKKKSDEGFNDEDISVLQPLSGTLAIAIANAKLYSELAQKEVEATTDELTGLLVRRAFMNKASTALSESVHAGSSCSLMMLDLDHFKKKNDTYGHLIGDIVLQETARRLSAMFRTGDLIGRYGGEEFIILLPNISRQKALEVAERLRQHVGGEPICTESGDLSQTVSIGVTSSQGNGTKLKDLIAKADKALYAAKRSGRNQVASSL